MLSDNNWGAFFGLDERVKIFFIKSLETWWLNGLTAKHVTRTVTQSTINVSNCKISANFGKE
jgi:hypothetical protein